MLIAGRHPRYMWSQQTMSNTERRSSKLVQDVRIARFTVSFKIPLRPQFQSIQINRIPTQKPGKQLIEDHVLP